MRTSLTKIGVYITSTVILGACVMSAATAAESLPQVPVESRIARVVDGLLPPVLVKGAPSQRMKLSELMAKLRVPAVSVAVIHDGRVDWAKAYGFSDFGGAPISPETLFYAPSFGRLVTALTVLRLADRKKINIDADVNTYLRSWKVPENGFTDRAKVTLRQLLSDSAGINVESFRRYRRGEPVPTLVQVLKGEKPATNEPVRVEAVPGTRWRYSGGGFAIVQQLLEDVTGQSFAELARELVFDPIGMSHSTYDPWSPKAVATGVATPFRNTGEPMSRVPETTPVMTSGGLWTTPTDMALCAIALQNAIAGNSTAIITRAMAKELLGPGLAPSTSFGPGVDRQALGVGVGGTEHPYFAQDSTNPGFRSTLFSYTQGDGIVVMSNSDAGSEISWPLLRAVAQEYRWSEFRPAEREAIQIDQSALGRFVGLYEVSSGGAIHVFKIANKLMLSDARGQMSEMIPASEFRFFTTTADIEYAFNVSANGEIVGGSIESKTSSIPITKVSEVTIDQNVLGRYVGRYQSGPGRTIEVIREGGRLFIQIADRRSALVALSDHEFAARRLAAKITFQVDERGQVTGVEWFANNRQTAAKRVE